MSRGIIGFQGSVVHGSRYISIPHLPPPRWISIARGTIRQVLMWIIVFGFWDVLGIFGYLYTSHYILLIYAPLLQRAASGSRILLSSGTTGSCRWPAYQESTCATAFLYISPQHNTLYSKEVVASAVEER
jgi:hypothetical protein